MPPRTTPPKAVPNPLRSTSHAMPPDHIFTRVILPSVSVSDLSLQMTDAEPRVSIAANLWTSMFW